MNKPIVTVELSDGSRFEAHIIYERGHPDTRLDPPEPDVWYVNELYHFKPLGLSSDPDEAKPHAITNLNFLTEALNAGDPALESLFFEIDAAVETWAIQEADEVNKLLEASSGSEM